MWLGQFWLRQPVSTAVITILLMLFTVHTLLLVGEDVDDRAWATGLVFVGILVSSGLTAWTSIRKDRRPPVEVAALLFAVGSLPYLFGTALLFLGAAAWSFFVALLAVGVHLAWAAWFLRRIGHAQAERETGTPNPSA